MVEYSERLKAAMDRAQMKTRALSDAIGVSYQGVKKVIDGKSNAFSAENNSRAAAILGVSPDWLATGNGAMLPGGASAGMPPNPAALAPANTAELTRALEKVETALGKIKATTPSTTVHIEHAWPFSQIKREQWAALSDEQKAIVESVALGMLATHSASDADKRQAAG